ncbi:MAG TPA: hydrogenase maturation nickel metallochaperone HypA [Pyrinomonadaceae bacterium]|nr:hydrogenase maturation nickel metallochaperone HypA [Pyrinomonadaceae bacterium]
MHEMAIAESVLDIAFGEMDRCAATRLNKVKLSIGEFSGVVKEALEFAFAALKPETRAAETEFEIDVVPLSAECSNCGPARCLLFDLDLICHSCGDVLRITGGREMKVEYLDID